MSLDTDKNANSKNNYQIPNLTRGLSVIEFLAENPAGSSVSEIAEQLKIPVNSVFRIVTTLETKGYLNRDSAKKYSLTRKLLSIGYAAVGEHTLIEKSLDVMRELRNETNETTFIGTITGIEGVILELIPSNSSIKLTVDAGSKFPLHASAPGKAMLAFLPDKEQKDILDHIEYTRFTKNTITDKENLLTELKKTAENGYAVDYAEHFESIYCVGSPILNHHAYPVASLWIVGLIEKLNKNKIEHIGKTVLKHASRISKQYGYYI